MVVTLSAVTGSSCFGIAVMLSPGPLYYSCQESSNDAHIYSGNPGISPDPGR
jgi:hypothetical protein